MQTLITLGQNIPRDIRIVGIDDVKYARLLPVPLTTQHQPCRDIGRVALAVMLDRISNPHLPPRDVLLGCQLMSISACGALQAILKVPFCSVTPPVAVRVSHFQIPMAEPQTRVVHTGFRCAYKLFGSCRQITLTTS